MNLPWSSMDEFRDPLIAAMVYSAAWFAMFVYGWTVVRMVWEKGNGSSLPRFLWSLGCFFMIVHLLAAFDVFYEWSHAKALEQTRLRSEALTGVEAGWGLYVNYLFVLLWAVDLAWWWIVGDARYRNRPKWILVSLHGFFLFMVFNSAFYFVQQWQRWLGLAVFLVSLVAVVILVRRPTTNVSTATP